MECKELIGLSVSAAGELATKDTDWKKRDASLKKLMQAYKAQPQFSVSLPPPLCESLAQSLATQLQDRRGTLFIQACKTTTALSQAMSSDSFEIIIQSAWASLSLALRITSNKTICSNAGQCLEDIVQTSSLTKSMLHHHSSLLSHLLRGCSTNKDSHPNVRAKCVRSLSLLLHQSIILSENEPKFLHHFFPHLFNALIDNNPQVRAEAKPTIFLVDQHWHSSLTLHAKDLPESTKKRIEEAIHTEKLKERKGDGGKKRGGSQENEPNANAQTPSSQRLRPGSQQRRASSTPRQRTPLSTSRTNHSNATRKQPSTPRTQSLAPASQRTHPKTPKKDLSTPRTQRTTPRTQPTTPRKEPSTPRTQPTTPRKEPSTPQTQPATPQKQPSTPIQPKTPQNHPSTPLGTPTSSKRRASATPQQLSCTPIRRVSTTPVRRVSTPLRAISTPQHQRVPTPQQKTPSTPQHRTSTPQRLLSTPKQRVPTPRRLTSTPHQTLSPAQKALYRPKKAARALAPLDFISSNGVLPAVSSSPRLGSKKPSIMDEDFRKLEERLGELRLEEGFGEDSGDGLLDVSVFEEGEEKDGEGDSLFTFNVRGAGFFDDLKNDPFLLPPSPSSPALFPQTPPSGASVFCTPVGKRLNTDNEATPPTTPPSSFVLQQMFQPHQPSPSAEKKNMTRNSSGLKRESLAEEQEEEQRNEERNETTEDRETKVEMEKARKEEKQERRLREEKVEEEKSVQEAKIEEPNEVTVDEKRKKKALFWGGSKKKTPFAFRLRKDIVCTSRKIFDDEEEERESEEEESEEEESEEEEDSEEEDSEEEEESDEEEEDFEEEDSEEDSEGSEEEMEGEEDFEKGSEGEEEEEEEEEEIEADPQENEESRDDSE